jgi:hypothetical protein
MWEGFGGIGCVVVRVKQKEGDGSATLGGGGGCRGQGCPFKSESI